MTLKSKPEPIDVYSCKITFHDSHSIPDYVCGSK